MSGTTTTRPFTETVEAIGDLITQGARIGMDFLDLLSCGQMSTLSQMLQDLTPRLRRAETCGCSIPPPCWAPQPAGEVTSHVCPGGTATLRLCVTNCGATARDIKFEAAGQAGGVTVTPASLPLGPMERGCTSASVTMPPDASLGQRRDILLWIRGCTDHFVRWTVRVATRGADACHEVDVEDCPDLIHHWYDHFYCERPCLHRG